MQIFVGMMVGAVALLVSSVSHAQSWPTRHVSMIVPFAAGAAIDVIARILAAEMSQHVGQQVVVENIGGAGGTIGLERVSRATPDGYQIVLSGVDSIAQARFLYAQLKYDSEGDFVPVALIADMPLLLTTRPTLPVSNVPEFVDYVRKNHEKMQFGSGGVGAGPYLTCALLNKAIGVNVTHVPYRGSAPAMQDLMAGRLDYYCPLAPAAISSMASESIKALAVLTETRSQLLPDLPTAKEQNLTVTEGYSWFAIFAPKGTPKEVVRKLNASAAASLKNPTLQARLKTAGSVAVSTERQSSEYLASYLKQEIEKWRAIIQASGIQPQ